MRLKLENVLTGSCVPLGKAKVVPPQKTETPRPVPNAEVFQLKHLTNWKKRQLTPSIIGKQTNLAGDSRLKTTTQNAEKRWAKPAIISLEELPKAG